MSPPGLLQLPPELMIWIMSLMDTPRNLSALIRSSQYIYQVFKRSDVAILAAVIENAMPDGNIHTAVAACKAFKVTRMWCEKKSTIDARAEFLKTSSPQDAQIDHLLHERDLLKSLCRLWWTAEHFASRFEQDASKYAAGKLALVDDQEDEVPRKFSRTRLLRAIYRFELFRRVHPTVDRRSSNDTMDEYDQVRSFLSQFPPWEREEMLSIQEFLVAFAQDMVKDTMDYMVKEVSEAARELAAKPGVTFEEDPVEHLRLTLDHRGFDIFLHNTHLGRRRFQYLVGRGLLFLRWLMKLPSNHKIDVISQSSSGDWRPTLFEFLDWHYDEFAATDVEPGGSESDQSSEDEIHSLNGPNAGWRWAENHGVTTEESHLLMRYDLRRMGYVFWEVESPSDSPLAGLTPTMLDLKPRSHDDEGFEWMQNKELSIQTRFKDIKIPKGALKLKDNEIMKRLNPGQGWEDMLEDGWPEPYSEKEAEIFKIEY